MKPKDSDDQFSSKFDFSRNSNAYSSLPNNIELKRQKKKQALEQLDKNNASSSIDRRRKTTPKNSNNKTKLDNAVSTQPYAVLNESLDYGYGLSNNLSSESIRNACDFYDDEISDTDLVEVHQTPQAFQNSKSNSLKRCLEESPLRALSLKQAKHSEQKEHETCFKDEDEALNVLSELDAILDNHEMLSMSEDAKVEDCLLELDDYLQKIEDDDDEQACNDDNIEHAVEDSMHFVHEANMHDLACEPSCPTEEDLSPSISDLGAGYDLLSSCSNSLNTQNCSSHATDLLLPLSCSKQTKLSQATDDAISPLNTSTPSNQPEVLTQDSIFNTLLIQNIPENSMEDRPRQFGRRAEGAHPLFLSINTQRSNANNVSNRLNQNQRPMSAPVASAAADNALELNSSQQAQSALFIGGSDASSARSSRNASPISIVSSSDYSSTAASTNDQMDTNLVMHENVLQNQASSCSDTDNETANAAAVGANAAASKKDFNHGWPWGLCRTFALLCCTLGLFNVCRFAVVTMNYGVNFLIQFAILSFIFGIPFLWLNMCLGAKIKSGPVSMWKISPICRGIGIALTTLQYIMAVYSIVALAWILSYLRNTIPHTADNHNSSSAYPWQQQVGFLWKYHNSTNRPITDTVANYFNVVVLQRFTMGSPFDNNFTSKFRVCNELAFFLICTWGVVFFILCKGLRSYGYFLFLLFTVPFVALGVVTGKLMTLIDPEKLQNLFNSNDFDDFLINSKSWTAAAQETFLTWGLLGASVISMSSRTSFRSSSKTALRRDALLVVFLTLIGLFMAALLGLSSQQILSKHFYAYVPGSYETPELYTAVYSLQNSSLNANILSYPSKWVPHYSSFIGETYRRSATAAMAKGESGYQVLRYITEIFPAILALEQQAMNWIWAAISFGTFFLLGLAQMCAMFKPISNMLGNNTNSVLLTIVSSLLLSIVFITEIGINILHYMDLVFGGSWILPILWSAQIIGVFLIRGRPYNGDDLVNDLKLPGSLSAFLALSWNVLLPIGLVTLAIMDYKTSLSNQFYHWRGKSYFPYWARKLAAFLQIGFLLLVPIVSIIQIYRYLSHGPADILERIQLLYRPSDETSDSARLVQSSNRNRVATAAQISNSRNSGNANNNAALSTDDAPPKYTPPPSYTTATGARLAKLLRQSIRRSVRRILGDSNRARPILPLDAESNQPSLPPVYFNGDATSNAEGSNTPTTNLESMQSTNTFNNLNATTNNHRTCSLGRHVLSRKRQTKNISSHDVAAGGGVQRPYTAEDVANILRSSARLPQQNLINNSRLSRDLESNILLNSSNSNNNSNSNRIATTSQEIRRSFRSVENLILNAEPPDHSSIVLANNSNTNNNNNNNNNSNQNNTAELNELNNLSVI